MVLLLKGWPSTADGGVRAPAVSEYVEDENVNRSADDVAEVPYPKMGALTLAFGLLLMVSVSLTPDWTVTFTVPDPLGTTAEICVSLSTVTELAGVLPKNTDSCPAAPEKFWPVMVMLLPGAPLLALSPVTTGVRFNTSKSP